MSKESGSKESATASAAVVVTDEQPGEFPVNFAEWKAGRAAYERGLVAGFEFHLRRSGGLQATKLAADWAKEFEQFQQAAPQ